MFAIPGLGRLMIGALIDRDYPLISGINLFFASAVMTINLLIDSSTHRHPLRLPGPARPVRVRERHWVR